MLRIVTDDTEMYDEKTGRFIPVKSTALSLEHSLISIAKWESKWHKPFLDEQKTEEEMLDYIRCMTITQNVDPTVFLSLSSKNYEEIRDYMEDKMTATWFNDKNQPKSKQKKVTAELIYYWMISLGVPFECEKWHINRLLTLIRVCNIESSPKKKMKKSDICKQNTSLNQARKMAMHSRG